MSAPNTGHRKACITAGAVVAVALLSGGCASDAVRVVEGIIDELDDRPAFELDRSVARARIRQADRSVRNLDVAPITVENTQRGIMGRGDAGTATDLLVFTDGRRTPSRRPSRCDGATCTARWGRDGIGTITLPEWLNAYGWPRDNRWDQSWVTKRSVRIGQTRTQRGGDEGDHLYATSLGGWLDDSGFVVLTLFDEEKRHRAEVEGYVAVSYGKGSGSSPVQGSARWTGSMIGTDVQSGPTRGNRVVGDASVHVDLERAELDVAFTNIRDITGGNNRRRSHGDMTWQGIALDDGAFAVKTGEERLDGRFYGSEHQEVGGTFERNQVLGAFGGRRE